MTFTEEKLKPCPFCGSGNVHLPPSKRPYCTYCGGENESIEAWNLRPKATEPPEQAWARGFALARTVFHQHAKLEENDPLWEITIPEYQRPES